MDAAFGTHRIAESRAPAVDEDEHMLAQLALLVENIRANLRLRVEYGFERSADRRRAHFGLGAAHVTLQMGGEHDPGHGEPV